MQRHSRTHNPRRGVAVIAFVAALLIIGSMVGWLFQITAGANTSALGHFYSTCAFYAAEGGAEMTLRELNATPATDFDSDGTIGTISNDGNAANDPAVATGAVTVSKTGSSPATYQSVGRPVQSAAPWSSYRRTVEIQAQ